MAHSFTVPAVRPSITTMLACIDRFPPRAVGALALLAAAFALGLALASEYLGWLAALLTLSAGTLALSRRRPAWRACNAVAATGGSTAALADRGSDGVKCRVGHCPRRGRTAPVAEPDQRMFRAPIQRRFGDGTLTPTVESAAAALRSWRLPDPVRTTIDGRHERTVRRSICGTPCAVPFAQRKATPVTAHAGRCDKWFSLRSTLPAPPLRRYRTD